MDFQVEHGRFVSRLTKTTLALILAGGAGSRLHELTAWRAKPAVPFGGKFRIIDLALSNCINSGIRRIGVLIQYKSHSLIRHLVHGWSGFNNELSEFVEILPAHTRIGVDHEEERARGFRVCESGLAPITPDMLGQRLHQVR